MKYVRRRWGLGLTSNDEIYLLGAGDGERPRLAIFALKCVLEERGNITNGFG